MKTGILLAIPGPVSVAGALGPLNVSSLSKLTTLSWLRFSVSKMVLHLPGGQKTFLKRKVVLEVTHL